MEKELEGLQYDSLVLDQNVHKLTGNLKKLQSGKSGDVTIDEGSFWLVTGLGQFHDRLPDDLIQSSLDDTIIISKSALIEFINSQKLGGWKNFKKEKPEKDKKIVVRGFQTGPDTIESGVGVYSGIKTDFIFGDREILSLRLLNNKSITYDQSSSGSKYRNPKKEDCDFEWSYLE